MYRSRTDKMVEGVCGGLGKYFGVDPIWFRLGFGLALVGGFGVGVLLYFLMIYVVPLEPIESEEPEAPETYRELETPSEHEFDFDGIERRNAQEVERY